MRSAPIEIACASRRDYLPHVATMLASALANAGAPIRANLLVGDDVADGDLAPLETMLDDGGSELRVLRPDPARLAGLTVTGTLPAAHWYRQLLPELPELAGTARALYLDADLLVLGSLAPLWGLDLGGAALAAVDNVFPDPDSGARYCEALGVEPGGYFNTGVMLLDLDELRRLRSFDRIRAFGRDAPVRLILPEQDAMNAVLAGSRKRLAPRWNSMRALELPHARSHFTAAEIETARAEPVIRHFEGSELKPWSPEAPALDRDLWARYSRHVPELLR